MIKSYNEIISAHHFDSYDRNLSVLLILKSSCSVSNQDDGSQIPPPWRGLIISGWVMVMCYEATVSSCLLPKLSSLCLYCPKVKRNSSKLYFSEFWLKLIIVLFLYSWSLFIMITSSPIKLHLLANQRPALWSCDHSRPIRGQFWYNNNKSASLIVKTPAELMTVPGSLGSVLYYYSQPIRGQH